MRSTTRLRSMVNRGPCCHLLETKEVLKFKGCASEVESVAFHLKVKFDSGKRDAYSLIRFIGQQRKLRNLKPAREKVAQKPDGCEILAFVPLWQVNRGKKKCCSCIAITLIPGSVLSISVP